VSLTNTSTLLLLATLGLTHLLAAMSPGPSFIMVARTAVAQSRAEAFAAALGMGVGACFWAAAAMLGLQALLIQVPPLLLALKIIGGMFLLYVAYMLWTHGPDALPVVEQTKTSRTGLFQSFRLGLATQLSNPKVIFFFASIFVALLPPDFPTWMVGATLAIVFVNETAWYGLVALGFSLAGPKAFYMRAKVWIDRITAGLLGTLGVKLIFDTRA
jgi:threonine/homoserine/homoserine lactone efflux protein